MSKASLALPWFDDSLMSGYGAHRLRWQQAVCMGAPNIHVDAYRRPWWWCHAATHG